MLKTFIWYPKDLGQVLDFYQGIFKENMQVSDRNELANGEIFTASFKIFDQEFIAMATEGGAEFNYSISLHVMCDGQAEVDYYWDALITDGGEPGNCGWLKDKFGLSWQVTPFQMGEHLGNPDPEAAQYAMNALRSMHKIVLADFVKA